LRFNGARFTNTALLALVLVLSLTGVYGLFWTLDGWTFTLHRAAGWGLLAILPWKIAIIARSLRRELRPDLNRGVLVAVSLFLSGATLAVLVLGLLWKGRFGPENYWLRQTAISWHWMLALGLLVPFFVHVWRRWVAPRRADFASRRGALRLALLGGLALAGYSAAQVVARLRELPGAPRRFSGSRRAGLHTGNRFPVTHTVPAHPEQVDPRTWRLEVVGGPAGPLALTYAELLELAGVEQEATLDCTLGWYTVQKWQGIPLASLLELAGVERLPVGIRLVSVTGYARVLPFAEARAALLATHVGGETLEPGHGFPLRAVVPSRRGWFWVKWLARIETVDFLEAA
jgi:hypothetical protein